MKKTTLLSLSLILALFFSVSIALASAPPVQSGTSGGTGGSTGNTQTFSAVTSGNVMVFAVYNQTNNSATITSSSFSCGTLTLVNTQTSASAKLWLYTAQLTSGGCTQVTFNFSAAINSTVIYAEYSGMATSTVTDCSVSSSGTGTAIDSGTCTTTNANDTLVGALFVTSTGGGTLTPGSGYTLEVNSASTTHRGFEDKNVSATGSYAATGTYSSSQSWIAFLVALKQAGSTVATPSADNTSGTYLHSLTVTLSDTTAGATICYTTDGSTPTASSGVCSTGTTYTTPVVLNANTTLKAIGSLNGSTNSAVMTQTYIVRDPTSFYVSNAGSDSNSGTDTTHTWAHAPGMTDCTATCASTVLLPGDSIYLNKGDSWNNTTLTVGYGGSSSAQITLSAYGTGSKPIISAAANNPAITVTAANRGYWTIDGLDLRASGTISGFSMSMTIYDNYWPGGDEGAIPGWIVQNCVSNATIHMFGPSVIIRNNTVDGTGNATASYAGIALRGTGTTGSIVEGNTVSNFSDRGIWVYNGGNGVIVRNNIVHDITGGVDNEGAGINLDGFSLPVSDNTVYGNTLYNLPWYAITNESSSNALIYNNIVHDSLGGISAIAYGSSRSISANGNVHHNLIYNVNHGIVLWDSSGWNYKNNTIYNGTGSTPIAFYIRSASTYISSLVFVNNIIAGIWTHDVSVPDNKSIWTQFDYNDIIPVGTELMYQASGGSKTLANLQSLGLMMHPVTTDPQFVSVSVPDFSLQSTSPAINAGTDVGLTTDINGNALVGAPDMGAYEYQTALADAYTFSGPSSGVVNAASSNFTITPNNQYSGTITITPSGGGLSTPILLTFSNSSAAQTFTIMPTAVGTVTLTPTNSGSLTNPSALGYISTDLPDTTPPSRSAGTPTGTLSSGTTSATLSLTTDEAATCRYSTVAGTAYGAMTSTFDTTGSTTHSTAVSSLSSGTTYTYYVRCADSVPNADTTDFPISFSVAQRSSGGGGGGHASGSTPPVQSVPVTTPIAPVAPTAPTTPATSFTRDISMGGHGEDIRRLQQYLNTHGFSVSLSGMGSLGQETTYFGSATKAALAKFQLANHIIPAAGYFGPKTRAFINAATTAPATPLVQSPVTTQTVSVTATNLNVRSTASLTGATLGTVPQGTQGILSQRSGNWAYVTFLSGLRGWVNDAYLK